jgi:hypothetical protein
MKWKGIERLQRLSSTGKGALEKCRGMVIKIGPSRILVLRPSSTVLDTAMHQSIRLGRGILAKREVSASDGDRLPAVQMVHAQKEGWKSYTDAATSRLFSPRPT